ncbi:GtrA family protein [Youxingia wuxianensis]|uniref:GtrA family protein n=1 Tax=Youxingia wuxianensis TaxID=2763678 RepID=A0A926EMG7_9FIRM|nr:GtrA family protein [Youxingia wuxianensis]MBC8585065.1 GtrA family protein [Youxingia wuxianensis]
MFRLGNLSEDEVKRIMKFGITGVANTLIDIGVYSLLALVLEANVFFSQCCGFLAGMLNSYLVNRSWTFKSNHRFFSLQLVKFVITNLIVLALSLLLLKIFIDFFLWGKFLAKLAATAITLVVNFLINRLWVFNN